MKTLKILRSTAEVIEVLGGNRTVQHKLDATSTAVSNWRNLDRFPWKQRVLIADLLKPLGYRVEQAMFGLSKDVIRKKYSKKKRRKKKPKPATTGRQSAVRNGGVNGRNKRKRTRQPRATLDVRAGHQAKGIVADHVGQPDRRAVRADAQRHHRESQQAQARAQETAGQA